MHDGPDIALFGATGKVGKAACDLLRARKQPFIALSRRPDTQNPEAWTGHRHADMDNPETLGPALTGVRRLFLCGPDHPDLVKREAAVLAAARSCGVECIVKLSAQCGSLSPPAGFGKRHAVAEQNLRESGLRYLILSPMFFSQSVFLFGERLREGKLFLPLTSGRVCYVDAVDVGQAVANCLMEPPESNTRYLLSGPEALSVADVLGILTDVIGRPVANRAMPKFLIPFVLPVIGGMNRAESNLLKELLTVLDEGVQRDPTPWLSRLLGRPATPFSEVAGRWAGQLAEMKK